MSSHAFARDRVGQDLSRRGFLSTLSSARRGPAAPAGRRVRASTAARGRLVIGADVNPVGLDPALTTAFASVAIYEQMYSSLGTLEYATNKVKPDLAESWKNVEPNVVEFKLRQGVKFHGGREVTAEDVKYTFDRLMDDKLAVPLRSYLGPGFTPGRRQVHGPGQERTSSRRSSASSPTAARRRSWTARSSRRTAT